MRVPAKVLNAVVFLGARDPDDHRREDFIGTAFIVAMENRGIMFPYIVTARHVAEALEQTQEPIARLNDAEGVGHHYQLRRPSKTELPARTVEFQGGHTVKLEARTVESIAWYRNPNDPLADVAVTEFIPSESWLKGPKPFKSLPTLPVRMFVEEKMLHPTRGEIGIGDEVFFTGLFTHAKGRESNSPICRVGTLAMLPTEAINLGLPEGFADVYLIEAKSMGRLSGSPVFVRGSRTVPAKRPRFDDRQPWDNWNSESFSGRPETVVPKADYMLLGLAHGHWKLPKEDIDSEKPLLGKGELNIGIAVVVPAYKILETLNHPQLVAQREDAAQSLTKDDATARDSGEFTRDDFMRDLGEVVRAIPPKPGAGDASPGSSPKRNRRKSGRRKP